MCPPGNDNAMRPKPSVASASGALRSFSTVCGSGYTLRSYLLNPNHQWTRLQHNRSTATSSGPSSSAELELTLALIKPSVCAYQPDVSAILKEIKKSGLNVARSKRLFWTSEEAHKFYAEHSGKFYYDRLIIGMTSGPSLALALYGPQAISRWRAMLGPTKAYKAKYEDPSCLRARYGLGDTRNGFHGSDSPLSSERELALIFEGWDSRWWIQREQGLLATPKDIKVL